MHIFTYKLMAIIASALILGQAYYIKKSVGTYIFPACIMALAWFFYTFIPLVALYKIPINPLPIFYIAVCILAFSLSALPFSWNKAFHINKQKRPNVSEKLNSHFLHYLFFLCSFCALATTLTVALRIGFRLESIIFNMRDVSHDFAKMRPAGLYKYDVFGVLSFFFTYLTAILGGLVTYDPSKKLKKALFVIATFLPTMFFMILQSAKIIIFYSIGFYVAALLLRKILDNKLNLINKKLIYQISISILLIIPFLVAAFSTRNGFTKLSDILNTAIHLFQSYAFAQIYAFADYFSFYIGADSVSQYQNDLNSYGAYTFTSFYNALGFQKNFPPGTFSDSYQYKDLIATNIFTIFRGLINDFGAVGTVIYMFISGLIIHAFYYRMLIKKSHIANSFFIIFVVYIEGTYLISVFMARYMYLLLVAMILIFYIHEWYLRKFRPITPN